MNINKRQIGIFLFALFVLISGLILYCSSLINIELNRVGEISLKSKELIIEWHNYNDLFLVLNFIVGIIATTLLISQKHPSNNRLDDNTVDDNFYQIEDIEVNAVINEKEKKGFIPPINNSINSLCKKNLPKYDFCKESLSIIGQHIELVQGAFYTTTVVNDEDCLELIAGYAFNKPEKGKIKFLFGEGLAGQVAKSKKTSHITDVPTSYLEASSGLGNSSKLSLYEFPILRKKEIEGVLELAFFKELSEKEIEELEKTASAIAKKIVELKKETQD